MEMELQVQPEHIAAFIHQAELMLQSRRVKTAFGREQSNYWIHAAIQAGNGTWPIIVVLQVRVRTTKGGRKEVRLFLADVRPPDQEEISEGGYTALPDSAEGLAYAARRLVLKSMEDAAAAVSKPPDLTKFSRGYLAKAAPSNRRVGWGKGLMKRLWPGAGPCGPTRRTTGSGTMRVFTPPLREDPSWSPPASPPLWMIRSPCPSPVWTDCM